MNQEEMFSLKSELEQVTRLGNANDSYEGPDRISGSSLINIQEAVNVGEFDGQIVWLLGANEANGFRVFQLEDPPRLVVDVCVVDASDKRC